MLKIALNKHRRIIYNLIKGKELDEVQQRIVDKIVEALDKQSTP